MEKMFKVITKLMTVTILCKVLGFFRELLFASSYGLSVYSDAYLIALNIPTVIFLGMGVAIGNTFIPLYFESEDMSLNGSNLFTNNIFNLVFIITIILSISGIVFAEGVVKVFAVGIKGKNLSLTVKFVRILMIGLIFTALSEVTKSYLNANNIFNIPNIMTGIPYNIIVILSIILSRNKNIYILVIGTLIAISSKFLFQLPFLVKQDFRYKFYLNVNDYLVKKMIKLVGPVFLGIAVNQINQIVDKTLASTLGTGNISALNYANQLNQFVIDIFIASTVVVVYPVISKLFSEKNTKEFINYIDKTIKIIIIIMVPITIITIVFSLPIVKILFERGAFDSKSSLLTSKILAFYAIGMLSFGIREVLNRIFYSMQNTKIAMKNGIICVCINIALNFIFIKYLKCGGIALATSISCSITVLILFIYLKREIQMFEYKDIIITFFKCVISGIVMGLVTYFIHLYIIRILSDRLFNSIVSLLICVIIGLSLYIILLNIFKVKEVAQILKEIKLKLIKNS
ncbi:murein biosynthesis integral membrane protein MurJ [Terrisporobacter sp.]